MTDIACINAWGLMEEDLGHITGWCSAHESPPRKHEVQFVRVDIYRRAIDALRHAKDNCIGHPDQMIDDVLDEAENVPVGTEWKVPLKERM